MSRFRVGEFERHRVSAPFRPFCPVAAVRRIEEVDLSALWEAGKRLILLDVDNTLTHWRSEQISAEVRDWIEAAKKQGFQLCILSNTRHPDRLERLSKDLDVPALRGKFKPSRAMYLEALEKYKSGPDETVMIGDQLLTDVFGANRSGIEAIWLEPLNDREFVGTKVNRWLEGHIVRWLYNALATPVDDEGEGEKPKAPFWERTIVKQFAKFAVVGGTSFVIDAGLTAFLDSKLRWGGALASPQVGHAILGAIPSLQNLPSPINWFKDDSVAGANMMSAFAALVAMFNSFAWNRRWTFQVRSPEERMAQLRRFFVVSIIGYVIQVSVVGSVFARLSHITGANTIFAKAIGAIVAAFWNFGGQRMYAFRKRDR